MPTQEFDQFVDKILAFKPKNSAASESAAKKAAKQKQGSMKNEPCQKKS